MPDGLDLAAVNSDTALLDRSLSVSEVNHILKLVVQEQFHHLRIVGEVSGMRPSANGHWYFQLKDEKSQLSAVMFRGQNRLVDFRVEDGQLVEAFGRLDVYEPRGTYQIVIETLRMAGEGALLAEIRKRKEYFASLGWFAPEGKPPIPKYPGNIGVVTASTGAAIKDILDTTRSRAPSVDITIYPTLVQGAGAAEGIADAIRHANELALSDVLIVGRGGGSVEDLMAFSDVEVIRAIHESEIPVISAVGHEIDNPISDLVASASAITPTAGAMAATAGWHALRSELSESRTALRSAMQSKYDRARLRARDTSHLRAILEAKAARLAPRPISDLRSQVMGKLNTLGMRLDYASEGAPGAMESKLQASERKLKDVASSASSLVKTRAEALSARLAATASGLEALDPSAVLRRGYAIAFAPDGRALRDAREAAPGDKITIRLASGSIGARAETIQTEEER